MGEIKQINQLENHISELGQEIKKVKQASVFLNEIDISRKELSKASNSIDEVKNKIQLNTEIIESKLVFFQSQFENINAKQNTLSEQYNYVDSQLKNLKSEIEYLKNQINQFNEYLTEIKNLEITIIEKVELRTLQISNAIELNSSITNQLLKKSNLGTLLIVFNIVLSLFVLYIVLK